MRWQRQEVDAFIELFHVNMMGRDYLLSFSLYFATTGLEGLSPVAFKMCLVLKCQLESSVETFILILNLFSIIYFAKGKINGIKVAVASL